MVSCYQYAKRSPALLGCGSCRGRNMGGLAAMGAEDRSQYDLAGNMLRQANTTLKTMEQQYQQAAPGTYPAAIGSGLIEARQRYTQLLQAYIYAYGVAFGPPDTAGLQQWQIYVATGVGIAVVVAGIYELNKFLNNQQTQMQAALVQANANVAQQSNITYAQQQLSAAQASGDQAAIDQWTAVLQANAAYGVPPAAQSFTDFLTKNAGWVAAGVAGLFLVHELL